MVACVIIGCKNKVENQSAVDTKQTDYPIPSRPYAALTVSPTIDLGEFTSDEMKKTATILVSNTGTDTLYIRGVQPDCLCTEAEVLDSVIAPRSNGRLQVSLDLTDYPEDTIYKEVAILSNDYRDNVKRFMLRGLKK